MMEDLETFVVLRTAKERLRLSSPPELSHIIRGRSTRIPTRILTVTSVFQSTQRKSSNHVHRGSLNSD